MTKNDIYIQLKAESMCSRYVEYCGYEENVSVQY